MRAQKIRRRPKLHRTYTYVEAAEVLSRHPNTVAGWAKAGRLTALTDRRPHIIRGVDLQAWLEYFAGIGDRVILARGFKEARAQVMRIARL